MATEEQVDALTDEEEAPMEPREPMPREPAPGIREAGAAPRLGAVTDTYAKPKPGGPPQEDMAPYIQKLHDVYERVKRDRDSLEQTGLHDNLLDDTGEATAYDNHPGDMGTEVFLRERDEVLESNQEDILRRCERALQKVDEGTYGYSDVSGDFIGFERLDAVPYATLTVDEQERIVEGG